MKIKPVQRKIAFVSENNGRFEIFSQYLADPTNKITSCTLNQAVNKVLIEEPFDLVVIDAVSITDLDYRVLEPIRSHSKLARITIVFILSPEQNTLKRQVYKNPYNYIVIEPVDKYSFLSLISTSMHLGQLEKRVSLYEDIIEGEKRLISYMDELLELSRIQKYSREKPLYHHLQKEFVKRLELAMAVEFAIVSFYDPVNKTLHFQLLDESTKKPVKKHVITLRKSAVGRLLKENMPKIFEHHLLLDPFVQELEESLGFKISGMLFVPLVVFHKPQGALILVNKVYRTEFSENDLAFVLIAAQRIIHHLETLNLKHFNHADAHPAAPTMRVSEKYQLFDDLLESVNFGVIVFDDQEKISFFNKAARELLHIKGEPEELDKILDEKAYGQFKMSLEQKDLPVKREEIQIRVKDSGDHYLGYSVYPLRDSHESGERVLIFSEISQTKRIQAEIIRMDRMASLGILSSGIAHEIRNPLAGIKAMAQTLEEELEAESHLVEYVERILRQVNRLEGLLKTFFSYAKPQRPNPKPCQIETIIREVLPLFERKMKEENITVNQEYTQDLYDIFVDSSQIEQVIFNLVINSIQAIKDGGAIHIIARNADDRLPTIDRRLRSPGLLSDKYIEICIYDNGPGIPPDIRDNIFNPFFTTKANGTGLGLSIVYQIVKEHGGQIDVESGSETGTEFSILLPAVVEHPAL